MGFPRAEIKAECVRCFNDVDVCSLAAKIDAPFFVENRGGYLDPLWVGYVNLVGEAYVVYGSRFLGGRPHRVLYFWHSLGNRFLTFVSNMFTDLNLTDMETCYKVFRRQVIQSIAIEEDRFGFEPEVTAKVAQRGLRVYEVGISYSGRTYAEGKKIGWRDGVRALYCVFRYNARHLPLPVQFLVYAGIGGVAAVVNLLAFLALLSLGVGLTTSTLGAFVVGAAANYLLCITLLFRSRSRWNTAGEVFAYAAVVGAVGGFDLAATTGLVRLGLAPWLAKSAASLAGLVFNFIGRRHLVFSRDAPSTPEAVNPGVALSTVPDEGAPRRLEG